MYTYLSREVGRQASVRVHRRSSRLVQLHSRSACEVDASSAIVSEMPPEGSLQPQLHRALLQLINGQRHPSSPLVFLFLCSVSVNLYMKLFR